jgi:hypothetical protein
MDEDGEVKPARQKDHSEIQHKREMYGDFMNWGPDRGILKDLADTFHVENPSLKFLVPIAQAMSATINVELDRQDKRRREFLIAWFNKNYDRIQPLIPHLVLLDEAGRANGPRADAFQKFSDENPSHAAVLYLNDEDGH